MYRSIMVPLDGSTFGEHALPTALSIACRSGADLHLVHVHTPLQAAYAEIQLYDATLDTHMLDHERAYLDGMAKRIKECTNVAVSIFVKTGDIAPTLRDHVHECGNDLVVMTTHGRGAVARFWLGSVTDELIRDLPNEPLLLVHPEDGPPDLQTDVHLRHFLIALDGTPLAEQILEPAVKLGKVMNAEYTLLRVIHPISPMEAPLEMGTIGHVAETMIGQIEIIQAELAAEAHEYLEKIALRLRAEGLNVRTQVALNEEPASGILQKSKSGPADVLALETHGRRGLQRLFLGSVAGKVIRGAKLPILIHRPVRS
jgi:nucleotide-binding universal stress UspA family protein